MTNEKVSIEHSPCKLRRRIQLRRGDGKSKGRAAKKYTLLKKDDEIVRDYSYSHCVFLAFHTPEQRDLFLSENEQLVKDYLMID